MHCGCGSFGFVPCRACTVKAACACRPCTPPFRALQLSENHPLCAICARGDLDPANPVARGCYDSKTTSWSLAMQVRRLPAVCSVFLQPVRHNRAGCRARLCVAAGRQCAGRNGWGKHHNAGPGFQAPCRPPTCALPQMQADVVNGPTSDGWPWSVPPFRWSEPVVANLTHRCVCWWPGRWVGRQGTLRCCRPTPCRNSSHCSTLAPAAAGASRSGLPASALSAWTRQRPPPAAPVRGRGGPGDAARRRGRTARAPRPPPWPAACSAAEGPRQPKYSFLFPPFLTVYITRTA